MADCDCHHIDMLLIIEYIPITGRNLSLHRTSWILKVTNLDVLDCSFDTGLVII